MFRFIFTNFLYLINTIKYYFYGDYVLEKRVDNLPVVPKQMEREHNFVDFPIIPEQIDHEDIFDLLDTPEKIITSTSIVADYKYTPSWFNVRKELERMRNGYTSVELNLNVINQVQNHTSNNESKIILDTSHQIDEHKIFIYDIIYNIALHIIDKRCLITFFCLSKRFNLTYDNSFWAKRFNILYDYPIDKYISICANFGLYGRNCLEKALFKNITIDSLLNEDKGDYIINALLYSKLELKLDRTCFITNLITKGYINSCNTYLKNHALDCTINFSSVITLCVKYEQTGILEYILNNCPWDLKFTLKILDSKIIYDSKHIRTGKSNKSRLRTYYCFNLDIFNVEAFKLILMRHENDFSILNEEISEKIITFLIQIDELELIQKISNSGCIPKFSYIMNQYENITEHPRINRISLNSYQYLVTAISSENIKFIKYIFKTEDNFPDDLLKITSYMGKYHVMDELYKIYKRKYREHNMKIYFIMEDLLKYIKDINSEETLLWLLKTDYFKPTFNNCQALKISCHNGWSTSVKKILKNEDVNINVSSNYCLNTSSKQGHIEVVKILLSNVNLNRKNAFAQAKINAAKNDHFEILSLLEDPCRLKPPRRRVVVESFT